MECKKHLDLLFDPHSIAVIGASSVYGKWGFNVLSRLLTCKNGKEIYAINNSVDEILGLKTYDSILDVPNQIDLAMITVPLEYLRSTIMECTEKGVKTAVIISSGLAETGAEGEKLEREIVLLARRGGLRFVGPNCLGHFNTSSNIITVPFLPSVKKGPIALISQSGNSSQSVFNHGLEMGLGFSKFVSSGNEADLHFEDYLEYLAQDKQTKIIMGYVEGLREGRRFFNLAKEISKKKPIIIIKSGRSDVGARAAHSHSAALAGSDVVLNAAFKQCGVIRVDELNELTNMATALLGQPLPKGKSVGVLAMGGGMAVVSVDALRKYNLEIPRLSKKTMNKLNSFLSPRWSHGNPVDPAGDFISYPILWPMIEDENLDSIIIIGGVGMASSFARWAGIPDVMEYNAEQLRKQMEEKELDDLLKTLDLMKQYQKPVIFTTMVWGAKRPGIIFRTLKKRYLNPYTTPETSAKVLALLIEYSEYLGNTQYFK